MRLLAVIFTVVLFLNLFCSSEAWYRRKDHPKTRPSNCIPPATTTEKWVNDWDQPFTFTCPSGEAMTEFKSLYSSCSRDRVFNFACRRNIVADNGRCQWSHYVNKFDRLVNFKCPYDGFITGIRSDHDIGHEDRRFKFRCCAHPDYHHEMCSSGSHFLSHWRKPLNFEAPPNHFLIGATSEHNNGEQDRLWKFETCEVASNLHDH